LARTTVLPLASVGSSLLLLSVPACTNDLSQLYCDPAEATCGPEGSGGTESEALLGEPPIVPFLPNEAFIESCEACVHDTCEAERDACLEDDACTTQLRCWGECSDPGCREECRARAALDGASPFYEDLESCTWTDCSAECNALSNYDCAGKYDWPVNAREDGTVPAFPRFGASVVPGQREDLADATLQVCDAAWGCGLGEASVRFRADLRAEVALPLRSPGIFRGFYELEYPDRGAVTGRYRIFDSPRVAGGSFDVLYWSLGVIYALLPVTSEPEGVIGTGAMDCTGQYAAGTSFELVGRDEVEVLHLSGLSVLPNVKESPLGAAFVTGLARGGQDETVTVRTQAAGKPNVFPDRGVLVSPGWITSVRMWPRSRLDD
jgi:hypothetical protein